MEDTLTVAVRALIQEETEQLRTEVEKLRLSLSAPPVNLNDDGDDDFSDMPKIMTTEMLAEQLPDVSKRTLEDWRWRKVGPVAVRDEQTRRVYYLKSDVVAWLADNRP